MAGSMVVAASTGCLHAAASRGTCALLVDNQHAEARKCNTSYTQTYQGCVTANATRCLCSLCHGKLLLRSPTGPSGTLTPYEEGASIEVRAPLVFPYFIQLATLATMSLLWASHRGHCHEEEGQDKRRRHHARPDSSTPTRPTAEWPPTAPCCSGGRIEADWQCSRRPLDGPAAGCPAPVLSSQPPSSARVGKKPLTKNDSSIGVFSPVVHGIPDG
jgi:hypothetical protein